MSELAVAEAQALAVHEAVIERGLATFVDVGTALLAIRDQRLYRAEYATFEDYCRDRWGMGRDYADRMITAASVVPTIVSKGLPAPANEGQARELARTPEGQRAEVWRETVERTGGKPTAAAVRATRDLHAAAALLLHRAGYTADWITEHTAGVEPPRTTEGITLELLDAALAYVRARGVTFSGVSDAAAALRAELGTPDPAPEPEPRHEKPEEAGADEPPRPRPLPADSAPGPAGVSEGDLLAGADWTPEAPALPEPVNDRGETAAEEAAAHARLDAELDAVMEGTDTRFRRNYAHAAVKAGEIVHFDPARLAEVFSSNFDRDVGDLINSLSDWCARVSEARRYHQRSGLRVVGGGAGE
ncbi:hypothetical protein [Streptomyces synnematoformans]|uniref:Uncharacterized protein n=1 Tax=Streptomyces synnematoformans TaxID=415721 RepID=A0ABN2X946_9ACTN